MLIGSLVGLVIAIVVLRVAGKTSPNSLLGKIAFLLKIVSHQAADAAISSTGDAAVREAIKEDRETVATGTLSAGEIRGIISRLQRDKAHHEADLADLSAMLYGQLDGPPEIAEQTAQSIAEVEQSLAGVKRSLAEAEAGYAQAMSELSDADRDIEQRERDAADLEVAAAVISVRTTAFEVGDSVGASRTADVLEQRRREVESAGGQLTARQDHRASTTAGQLKEFRKNRTSPRAADILAKARAAKEAAGTTAATPTGTSAS